MSLKLIGSLIVILGCGGFGFRLAALHRMSEKNLRQLIAVLDFMESELEYRQTPLPELCRLAGFAASGTVRNLLEKLTQELESQIAPDAQCCMTAAISGVCTLTPQIKKHLHNLGTTLGRFDLPGQLRGLASIRQDCRVDLEKLTANQELRIRSYQTLGLCAGGALAILLL